MAGDERFSPRLSVAMATYNGAPFVCEQLQSMVRQGLAVDEIVICDDGSSDGTIAAIEQFSETTPGLVRLYRNPHRLGYAQNFARAIELTTGDIIFLSDQDDMWLPAKVETMVARFAATDCDLVAAAASVTDVNLVASGKTIRPNRPTGPARAESRPGFFSHGCTLAFRSRLRPWLMPIAQPWCHDSWICFVASATAKVEIIDLPLMLYRRHAASAGANHRLDHGWLGEFEAGWKRMSRTGYLEKIASWQAMYKHLEGVLDTGDEARRATDLPLKPSHRREEILEGVAARRDFYAHRMQMTAQPRHLRIPAAFHTLLSGRYHEFAAGWRSLAKDLIVV